MSSPLVDSKDMDCVNFIVRHTFIEVQGLMEEVAQRRRSDVCPIRASSVFDFEERGGFRTPSTCPSDYEEDEDYDEDGASPIQRKVSFTGSVDSDEIIGMPCSGLVQDNASPSSRRVSTCSTSSKVSLPSFAGSIDDDDIVGSPLCSLSLGSIPWQTTQVCEPSLALPCADGNDVRNCMAPALSIHSSYSHDASPMHHVSIWQPACEVLSTPCSEQGLQNSRSSEELDFLQPESVEDEDRTTIMVRNLPSDLTQTEFVIELSARGYRGLFDFVYMPMNFRSDGNFGYAFVNFTSARVAMELINELSLSELDDQEWRYVWSTCQGVNANIERYRNSPLMHALIPAECKPALYDTRGCLVQFPAPTKNIPRPRIHYPKNKAPAKDQESQDVKPENVVGSRSDAQVQCRPGKGKKHNNILTSASQVCNKVAMHATGSHSKEATNPR
jgi:hypothetical protein